MDTAKRKLVLQDGTEYYGYGFGSQNDRVCEVVFNTSMIGYQEVVSDLTNAGRAVVMTYPLIGNCGIVEEDLESKTPALGALIVREYNDYPSNFRTTQTLVELLEENGIPGLTGVDTRRLSKHIRDNGIMRGLITDACVSLPNALEKINDTPVRLKVAGLVSCRKKWYSRTSSHILNIVVVDCGVKLSIIKNLNKRGCNVTIVPFDTSAKEIEDINPDGIIVSSGPGRVEGIPEIIRLISSLTGKYPIFGIGLGCLAIAKTFGAQITRLPYGHHGDNHPVENLITGKLETANQNHDYTIDEASLESTGLTVALKNVTDSTVEGIVSDKDALFGLLYYYDLSPDASDTSYMLDRFLEAAKEVNKNA